MQPKLSYFLLRPRYWLGLIFFSLIYLIAHLPIKLQIKLAKLIGWLTLKFAKRRKTIAEINLSRCFAQKSKSEIQQLLRENFFATALGLVESAACWFTSLTSRLATTKIIGAKHLDDALAKGKGVILLSFHMTSLEIGGSLLGKSYPVQAMYKPSKNNLVESLMCAGRLRHVHKLLKRDDLRTTLKALKKNGIVWYATDQNYGNKSAVFVPFFDIQASTITATTKFAKLTGATIVPFTQKRIGHGLAYELQLHPALDNFPGDNEHADALRINQWLENYLTQNPVDYMWLHQRFRTRPVGEENFYPEKN